MTNTNITNFRKNLFEYIEQAIEFNDVINVSTRHGNAVVMSEQDYRDLMETLYINSVPGLAGEIKAAAEQPIEECSVYNEDEEW